jgi:hypothetical protein
LVNVIVTLPSFFSSTAAWAGVIVAGGVRQLWEDGSLHQGGGFPTQWIRPGTTCPLGKVTHWFVVDVPIVIGYVSVNVLNSVVPDVPIGEPR